MAEPRSGRICVAQFGAAHGVRGEVRLKAFTEEPAAVTRYGPLESEDGSRRFEIVAMRPAKEMHVVRLRGIDDRSAAEALCHLRLFVPRDRLPAPNDDEFYHADLVGLTVTDLSGSVLGRVTAVHNFGAGDMLDVLPVGGGDSVLVPFSKAAVPTVDIAAGRLMLSGPLISDDDDADAEPEPGASGRDPG